LALELVHRRRTLTMEHQQSSDEEISSDPSTPELTEAAEPAEKELSAAGRGNIREIFRNALGRARRGPKPLRRRNELSRDKSKSMFLLASMAAALLLVFLGVFSAPKKLSPSEPRRQPNLGRKVTPRQAEGESGGSITPLLEARQQPAEAAFDHPVTAEDVGRTSPSAATSISAGATSRPEKPSPANPKNSQVYALNRIDFPDPPAGPPPPPPPDNSELKKPAIVFVRSTQSAGVPVSQPAPREQDSLADLLPAGTRLLARLEAPVSSDVAAAVVAVVEYNYEREDEIVLPAGAKVLGKLVQAHPSGFVALAFEHIEMPDGSTEKIHATAMDLNYRPLKGTVSGKRKGAKFLVSSLSGVGASAAYMVGGHSNEAFNGPLSENSLLRERVADNVGNAGQGELNQLSFNQNIVVTIPANTRFYLVLEEGGMDSSSSTGEHSMRAATSAGGDSNPPTLEELRELIELRRELSQMYQQNDVQPTTVAPTPAQ
jgi:type IV secretory pathway VirB10-like protein